MSSWSSIAKLQKVSVVATAATIFCTLTWDNRALASTRTDLEQAARVGAPGFAQAVLALQKLNYREERWQAFFGLASYYRWHIKAQIKKHGPQAASEYEPKILELETIALSKHCRWDHAAEVIRGAQELSRTFGRKETPGVAETIQALELLPALLKTDADLKLPPLAFSKQTYWPNQDATTSISLSRIQYPAVLRKTVGSFCGKIAKNALTDLEFPSEVSEADLEHTTLWLGALLTLERAIRTGESDLAGGAYTTLQYLFLKLQTPSWKGQTALLLAFAPLDSKSFTLSRAFFAEFAIGNAPIRTTDMSLRLHRVLADEQFADGKLDDAAATYTKALALKDLHALDRAYLRYQLGWVRMNQSRPDDAYQLWNDEVAQQPDLKHPLVQSIIRDTGKAWAEANMRRRKSQKELLSLPEQIEGREEFLTGLASALRREQLEAETLDLIKITPTKTELRRKWVTLQVSRWLQNGPPPHLSASAQSCRWLDWYEESDLSLLTSGNAQIQNAARDTILSILTKCSDQKGSHPRISALVLKLPLTGKDRVIRAELLAKSKDNAQACVDHTALVEETRGELAKRWETDWLARGWALCNGTLASRQKILDRIISDRISGQIAFTILTESLRDHTLRTTVLNALHSQPEFWAPQPIVRVALESEARRVNPASTKDSDLIPLLREFAPRLGWGTTERAQLLDYVTQVDRKSAVLALEELVPLEKTPLWGTRLWLTLALKEPQDRSLLTRIAPYFLAQITQLPRGETLSKAEQDLGISLPGITGQMDLYAKHWAWMRTQVPHSSTLAITLIAASLDQKISLPLDAQASPTDAAFLALLNPLSEPAASLTKNPITRAPGPQIKGLYDDVAAVRKSVQDSSKVETLPLVWGPKLEAQLMAVMKRSQALVLGWQKHRWHHRVYVVQSRNAVAGALEKISQRLETLPGPGPEDAAVVTQLKEIATMIRSWIPPVPPETVEVATNESGGGST